MTPCYDAQSAEEDRVCRERLTHVTRMLCDLCEAIDTNGLMNKAPPELQEWWEEHREADAAREARP